MFQNYRATSAVILTALVISALAHQETVKQMGMRQQTELAPLASRTMPSSRRPRKTASRSRPRTLCARHLQMRGGHGTDEEMQKLNTERMNALAEAIAKKVMPFNPMPKSAEEAEKQQNDQVDKVSGRMTERIQPILTEMARDQNLTRESISHYSQRISDQVGNVLTAELAKNQLLNNNLQETQATAQDALKLSHEITALYLSSFKDQGIITRLLSLPANVVKDAASLSIVTSSDRKKVEEQLVSKMAEIEKRLTELQAAAPKPPSTAAGAPPLSSPTRPATPPAK